MTKIVTLTGESGSGKSSIASYLLDRNFHFIVSTTTRAQRPSDSPREYEYLSVHEFNQLDNNNAFIWTINYAENNYGTKYAYIDEALQSQDNHLIIFIRTPLMRY